MAKYRVSDDGFTDVIEAESMAEALEAAEGFWQEGSWDGKCLISVRVEELDEDGKGTGNFEWVEVECGEGDRRPRQQPRRLVHGRHHHRHQGVLCELRQVPPQHLLR
jgi:hypothetical protein